MTRVPTLALTLAALVSLPAAAQDSQAAPAPGAQPIETSTDTDFVTVGAIVRGEEGDRVAAAHDAPPLPSVEDDGR